MSAMAFVLLFFTQKIFYPVIPDVNISPGSYCSLHDPDFKETRYKEMIPVCYRNVSSKTKDAVCRRDGVVKRIPNFTVDHIVPLSMGGSNRIDNLWCQHVSLNTSQIEYHYYLLLREDELGHKGAVNAVLNCKFAFQCNFTRN